MEEESISDANNVTGDTFSHTPNTKIDNKNVIFTSEKLDKSDEIADALKYLTTNNAGYYASNSATASDTQGNLTRNTNTVNHTSNEKEKFMETRNGDFEQNILSNRTLPVVVPTMYPVIDYRIVHIVGASQTLSTPATKEVIVDASSGNAWVNRNPR